MIVGLYFGSFNPIHCGHLTIAHCAVQSGTVQAVWFVVSPQSPFKQKTSLLSPQERLFMVRLAIGDNYKFNVTDIEFAMPQPNFTVDTLACLSEKYLQHTFKLIIGSDQLHQFSRWKNYEKIIEQFTLIVYPRDKEAAHYPKYPNMEIIEAPLIHISASLIRKYIRSDKSIRYLVPDEVCDYIKSKKLYV